MTVKTDISRFDIHDELTAPDASATILKGMQSAGGSVSKFIGVLAGAPAALRAYARMRHELRGGALPRRTRERIALGVAERRGDPYSIAQHARTARAAGLGLDEIARARSFTSSDPREAALLEFLRALLDADGRPKAHLGEEAREVGWTDEELLEAVAQVALNEFQSLIANAAALPQDQTDPAVLPSAAKADVRTPRAA
jgi:AhpD family alkylhydroperoxidase